MNRTPLTNSRNRLAAFARAETKNPHASTGESDLDLLHCFANFNDTDSFALLVQRHANVIYATALRVLGDGGRAEDVCQETFFRLMRRPHEINQNVGAWLHRTATHLALDVLRSETSRRRREIVYTQNCDHEATTWSELSPAVDQAITELPEEMRVLLVRHFLLGQSQAHIANESEQSPATVSRRMKQALDELRLRLRLKGIGALSVTLAALLCHASARQAPASLLRELGKITMIGGSGMSAAKVSVAAKGGATGLGRAAFHSASQPHLLSAILKSQALVMLAGILGAYIALQVLTGAWTIPGVRAPHPNIEPNAQHHHPQGAGMIEGLDPARQNLMKAIRG